MRAVGFKDVPTVAMRLSGECELAADGKRTGGNEPAPVSILARSAEAVEHPYWGRVVHDFEGMLLSKPRVPLDWHHDVDVIIGYADAFDVSAEGLRVGGMLVPNGDDKAAEVIFKAGAGVPYEASLNFAGSGIKVEEIGAGETAMVNGAEFVGPGAIIREWPLRGVAICPYGADQNTAAEFSANGDGPATVSVERIEPGTIQRGGGAGIIRFASSATRLFAGVLDDPAESNPEPAAGPAGLVRLAKGGVCAFSAKSGAQATAPAGVDGKADRGAVRASLIKIRK